MATVNASVFPAGTEVGAYALPGGELPRRSASVSLSAYGPEETVEVAADLTAEVDVPAGSYALIGEVDGKRKSVIFTVES
jgi:hypothetical protein